MRELLLHNMLLLIDKTDSEHAQTSTISGHRLSVLSERPPQTMLRALISQLSQPVGWLPNTSLNIILSDYRVVHRVVGPVVH